MLHVDREAVVQSIIKVNNRLNISRSYQRILLQPGNCNDLRNDKLNYQLLMKNITSYTEFRNGYEINTVMKELILGTALI